LAKTTDKPLTGDVVHSVAKWHFVFVGRNGM